MRQNYSAFVERMIGRYEGGYGWDANDSGGPTKYGITCYDLAWFLHQKMTSKAAWAPRVKAMSLATADEIYRKKYATACQFDSLNSGCDCVVFDFGVNSGPSRSIKFAQRIVGVSVDGVLGPVTLKAINGYDSMIFVNALCDARMGFLRGLRIWGTFGKGWTARVKDLRQYSARLVVKGVLAEKLATPEPKEGRIPLAFAKGATSRTMLG